MITVPNVTDEQTQTVRLTTYSSIIALLERIASRGKKSPRNTKVMPRTIAENKLTRFYRAIHFSIEIACHPSLTLVDQDHIGWKIFETNCPDN